MNNKFEKIVSRMVADFPMNKIDWNKKIAPYLREIQGLLEKTKTEAIQEGYNRGRIKLMQQHDYVYKPDFEKELKEKWEKKKIVIKKGKTHPVHDKCENCFELAMAELKEKIEKKLEEIKLNKEVFYGK